MGMVRRIPTLLVRPTALQPRAIDGEREQSCRRSREHEQEHCVGARQPDLEPACELRSGPRVHLRESQNRGWTQGEPEPAPSFGEIRVLGRLVPQAGQIWALGPTGEGLITILSGRNGL